MAKVERSITINAPVDRVFAYITDLANEIEYIPSVTDIRDITGTGVGQRCGWTYKMMGIPLKGEAEITEYIPNQRYVLKSKGGILSTWAWTFKAEASKTRLNVVVEYIIPVRILSKLGDAIVQRLNEREADLAMANIKERMEWRAKFNFIRK